MNASSADFKPPTNATHSGRLRSHDASYYYKCFLFFFFAYKLGKTIFKRFIGKRLVRTHSVLGWLRVINDSQPKQISPLSRRASAHISSTRHAAILPLVMFLLDFSPSSSLRLRLQGIAPLFSLSSFHHSE